VLARGGRRVGRVGEKEAVRLDGVGPAPQPLVGQADVEQQLGRRVRAIGAREVVERCLVVAALERGCAEVLEPLGGRRWIERRVGLRLGAGADKQRDPDQPDRLHRTSLA
jgi:hypothetical protein